MWKCHKCGKPVYFAERKQSVGYDWHPECLRCEECGKRLNPGQHAEHKGVPYCHVPCYGALFGPQLYGHGTRVESHTSFGKVENKPCGMSMPRSHLETKLKMFNQYYEGKSSEVKCREVNGRLVLEGAVRIYWGVSGVIHLKEDDDQRTVVTIRKRNSYRYSGVNGFSPKESNPPNGVSDASDNTSPEAVDVEKTFPDELTTNLAGKSLTLPSKLDLKKINWDELDDILQVERSYNEESKLYQTLPSSLPSSQSLLPYPATCNATGGGYSSSEDQYSQCFEDMLESQISQRPFDRSQSNPEYLDHSLDFSSDEDTKVPSKEVVIRTKKGSTAIKRRPGKRRCRVTPAKLKRRCSINGHFYNRETSFFTPPFGSQMSVWVTSLVSTHEVINLMLDKYKVDSPADNFALFVVRDNGEQRILKDDEYPLLVRVMLGPHEDVAKLYLMDRGSTKEISSEVAQFLNLSTTECNAILEQFKIEEAKEEKRIIAKYREVRRRILQRMEDLKVRL